MTLFLVPIRKLVRTSGAAPVDFPALVTAAITLGPEDAFGMPTDLRTTVGRGEPRIVANLDEGSIHLVGGMIEKIEADFQLDTFRAQFDGNILTLSFLAASYDDGLRVLNSAIQLLPLVLHPSPSSVRLGEAVRGWNRGRAVQASTF